MANGKAAAKPAGKPMDALEQAKARFAAANKKLAENRKAVTAAKRTIATADKRISALDKKIDEVKDAPSKAAELLIKKAEEMERRAAELEAEQAKVLKDAEEAEAKIKAKEDEMAKAKEESDAKMEEMGIPKTTSTRGSSPGTASEKRQKNNFQYRLKSKGWEMNYNLKGRIEGADKYGLHVDFQDDNFVVTKDGEELLNHSYGDGSLTALATCVKDNGEGVTEE